HGPVRQARFQWHRVACVRRQFPLQHRRERGGGPPHARAFRPAAQGLHCGARRSRGDRGRPAARMNTPNFTVLGGGPTVLMLCGTSPSFGKADGDWQREFIAERTAPLDAGKSMAELAEVLVPQMVGPGSLPEGVKLATHCMSLVPPATYRRALEALVTFDRRANLSRIDVPALLVAGEHDRNAPPEGMKKMADQIPR